MDHDKVILHKEGTIARILLNNAARLNAISMAIWRKLGWMLDDVAEDPAIRAVVISGTGGKAFSARADISEFDRRHADAAAVRQARARDAEICAKRENLDTPTIAEIERYCLGGPSRLRCAATCAFCSEDPRFGIPPAKLGHCCAPEGI